MCCLFGRHGSKGVYAPKGVFVVIVVVVVLFMVLIYGKGGGEGWEPGCVHVSVVIVRSFKKRKISVYAVRGGSLDVCMCQ